MPLSRSPRVRTFANERGVARALAERLATAIARKPRLVLGLPTGRTPVLLYRELAMLHMEGRIDFSRVSTFNLDEFYGVPPSDPGSYRTYMQRHLFSRVNISTERVHCLDGGTTDPDGECRRYEQAIAEAGGIDLQILGIGTNGHIGFNEPARELQSYTHRVTLKPETRRSNAALFGGDAARVPAEALSMGMATILHARAHRAAGDREVEGFVRRARDQRADHHGPAGVVPATARRRGADAGSGGSGEAGGGGLIQARSSARRRGSMSSPMASRTESSDFLSRLIACGRVRSAFCMTMAALTFHLARLSSASASLYSMPVTIVMMRRARSFSFSDPLFTSTIRFP